MKNITVVRDYKSGGSGLLREIRPSELHKYRFENVSESSNGFGFNFFNHDAAKVNECILVPGLMRCIGIAFHVLPKNSPGEAPSTIGYHINPLRHGSKRCEYYAKHFLKSVHMLLERHTIPAMYVAGGRLNKASDKYLYEQTLNLLIHPIPYVLPDIKIVRFETFEGTEATLLTLSRTRASALRQMRDGKLRHSTVQLSPFVI